MNEESINLKAMLDALKKRWQLIAAITLIAVIISAIVSFFVIKPKYKASAKLLIGKENSNESYNNNDVLMYQKLIKTYSDVLKTNDLVTNALENHGIDESSESVLSKLSVTPKTDTQILEVTYIDEDKDRGKETLEAIVEEFVEESKDLIKNSSVDVIEKVRLPKQPISPNKKLNIIVAFFVGAFIGIFTSIIIEFVDTTIKEKENLEEITGVPVIGAIPNWEKVK